MSEKRKLSAVLFADITGYTSLMLAYPIYWVHPVIDRNNPRISCFLSRQKFGSAIGVSTMLSFQYKIIRHYRFQT